MRNLLKNVNKFVAAAAIIMLISVCSVVTAFAQETQAVILPNGSQTTSYFYFEMPTAIYADDKGFTVADGDNSYAFNGNGEKAENQFTGCTFGDTSKFDLLYDRKTPVLLSDSHITVGTITLDGEYTDFAVLNDKLYAIPLNKPNLIDEYDITSILNNLNGNEPNEPNESETEDENGEQNETEDKNTDSDTTKTEITATPHTLSFTPVNIAADNRQLYATEKNGYLYNVRYFTPTDNGLDEHTNCLNVDEKIHGICGKPDGGAVILTRSEITAYSYSDEYDKLGKISTHPASDTELIAAYGNTVYAVTKYSAVYKWQTDSAERTYLLASRHDEPGFYNNNRGVASRKDFIAVADEYNNRVQIIRNGRRSAFAATHPTAVAIDYVGNIFVAHDGCSISVHNGTSFALIGTLNTDNIDRSEILDMQFDSDNNLYVLTAKNQLFISQNSNSADCKFEQIENVTPNSFYICKFIDDNNDVSDIVYIADENGIHILGSNSDPEITVNATDFCVDHKGKIFAIVGNEVKAFTLTENKYGEPETYDWDLKGATQIIMSTVEIDGMVKYGDLIISDTKAHAIITVDGNAEDVNVNSGIPSGEYKKAEELENHDNLKAIEYDDEGNEKNLNCIIYEVEDCYVYAGPIERNSSIRLPSGYKVIIPEFNPDSKFNLIIADSRDCKNKPIIGYIYTNSIKAPLPYTATPPNDHGRTQVDTPVYKFPTEDLQPIERVSGGTKLGLISFVSMDNTYGYKDNYYDNDTQKSAWYRVSYTENDVTYEGYVKNYYISILDENPDSRKELPRNNATVKNKYGADLYTMNEENGKIVQLAVTNPDFIILNLKHNTRVEVDGYDSSEEFTKIKYYVDESVGTMEFYVKTEDLKYDGVNKVVVIAIVIIIVTLILGAILVARIVYVKRTGRTKDKF